MNRVDSDKFWPTAIKDTIQWFTFLTIMEHTANILKPNKETIHSLLKVFSMLELRSIDYRDNVEAISIRCINSKKSIGLYLGT